MFLEEDMCAYCPWPELACPLALPTPDLTVVPPTPQNISSDGSWGWTDYLPVQLSSALEQQSNIQSLAAQPHLAARNPRLHSELQDMANRPMAIAMDAVWNWSWGMPIPVVVTGAMRSWWTGTQPPVGHH